MAKNTYKRGHFGPVVRDAIRLGISLKRLEKAKRIFEEALESFNAEKESTNA